MTNNKNKLRYLVRPHVAMRVLVERRIGMPMSRWLVNWIFQRIFRLNSQVPFQIHFTSTVSGKLSIGRNVWKSFALSGGCYVQGINGIEIGDDTIFAPGVKIISANHRKGDLSKSAPAEPIRIGKRCWIASNSVILPGVQLGDDVIVGAGAVVTKSFPSGSVIGGVPAKLISRQPSND
jgi:acetyltransferase-like isoleucine patch superfamily enzyme